MVSIAVSVVQTPSFVRIRSTVPPTVIILTFTLSFSFAIAHTPSLG
jgi:hypothetical protein